MDENDKVTLTLPARHLYLSMVGVAIESLIKRLGGSERAIYDIQIALQEICANVVDHAYDGMTVGSLTIETTIKGNEICIFVVDQGRSFDPKRTREPALGQLQDGGYGLFFARKLMDEVRYDRLGHENRWTLRKALAFSVEAPIY